MTTTVTKSPGRGTSAPSGTEKWTSRWSRARPESRWVCSDFLPASAVTSSSTCRPTTARFSSAAIRSCSATSRSKRSCTTAFGTWSAISPAGVPGRTEYWNVYAEEKREAATTSRVAWKSSSVSPGKPTMMSVVIAASGMRSRTVSRIPRNRFER